MRSMRSKWHELFAAEQRKLPRGASRKERGEATRRASRIYRGRQLTSELPASSNPDGQQLGKLALIAGAVYLAYAMLNRPPTQGQVTPTPSTLPPGVPLSR